MIVASLGLAGDVHCSSGWRRLLWLVPWQRAVRAAAGPGRRGAEAPASRWRRLIGKWPLWAMGIGHAAGNYCFYFLLAWLPLYLVQERGFTHRAK